jgi:hypothetical protein
MSWLRLISENSTAVPVDQETLYVKTDVPAEEVGVGASVVQRVVQQMAD